MYCTCGRKGEKKENKLGLPALPTYLPGWLHFLFLAHVGTEVLKRTMHEANEASSFCLTHSFFHRRCPN